MAKEEKNAPPEAENGQETTGLVEFDFKTPKEAEAARKNAENCSVTLEKARSIGTTYREIERIRQEILELEPLNHEAMNELLRGMAGTTNIDRILEYLFDKTTENEAGSDSQEVRPGMAVEDQETPTEPTPWPDLPLADGSPDAQEQEGPVAGQPDRVVKPVGENEVEAAAEDTTVKKEFERLFGKGLLETNPQDETTQEALRFLSQYLNSDSWRQFSAKIEQIQTETGFDEIKQKQDKILKTICEAILKGHATAEDMLSLNRGGLKIISEVQLDGSSGLDDETKGIIERIKEVQDEAMYEGIAYFDRETKKIIVFKKTLADGPYKTAKGESCNLDLQHIISHELSHSMVDRFLTDKTYQTASNFLEEELLKNKELLRSQPKHIRNTIEGYQKKDEQEREKFKPTVVLEILADYTAIYLQSDGTSDDFYWTALRKAFPNDPDLKGYLQKLGLAAEQADALCQAKGNLEGLPPETKEKIEESTASYAKLFDIVKNGVRENKGNFKDLSPYYEQEGTDLDFDTFGSVDSAAGFQQDSHPASKGDATGGFWNITKELVKAMATEFEQSSGMNRAAQ